MLLMSFEACLYPGKGPRSPVRICSLVGRVNMSHALFWYASAAVSMVSPEPKCGPPPML
jgi:hypothetical protein